MSAQRLPSCGRCLDAEIAGAVNLRDLGGYAARGGSRVRSGLAFRSGVTHHIEPHGLSRLRELHGIRRILDLRSDRELERDGTLRCEASDIVVERVPVYGTTAVTPDTESARYRDMVSRRYDWCERYRVLLSEYSASFVALLRTLAGPAGMPAIFHCSAGRDRTGIAAALLLGVLGVSREDIAMDYAASGEHLARHVGRYARIRDRMGFSDSDMVELFRTEAEDMLKFLDWLAREHSGPEAFLLRAGLRAKELRALRDRLLESASP